MSLAVWLPLNGDLHNQGLNKITVVNNGAVINNGGKIGQCYSFDKSIPSYLKIDNPITSAKYGITFTFWIKIAANANGNNQIIHIGNGAGWNSNRCTCFIRSGTSQIVFCCGDGTDTSASHSTQYNCISSAIDLNTWVHITCIYFNKNLKIYINGIQNKSYDTTIIPSFTNVNYIGIGAAPNAGEPCSCMLNDVRIYDHCLSQKEVEELSKALVVHYTLDNVYNNIIYDSSGYQNDATVVGTYTMNNTSARFTQAISMNNTSTANRIYCNKVITLPTTGITVSFWTYTTKSKSQVLYIDQYMSFAINSGGTAFYVSRSSAKGYPISYFPIGQWNHVVLIRAGTTYTVYINGIVVPQTFNTSTNWSHNVSNIYLLNRSYNNTYAANASIADFREYATALTEEQVLELYNTSVTIDNKGNIYSREYIENDDNLNITKSGLFQSSIIHDDDNLNIASILKTTKQIQGNTLYEY